MEPHDQRNSKGRLILLPCLLLLAAAALPALAQQDPGDADSPLRPRKSVTSSPDGVTALSAEAVASLPRSHAPARGDTVCEELPPPPVPSINAVRVAGLAVASTQSGQCLSGEPDVQVSNSRCASG